MDDTDAVHLPHGRTAEQMEIMRRIKEDGIDPFDWEELPNYHFKPVLHQSKHWLVTENDYPYDGAELHLLLIYRERVRFLHEVTQEGFSDLHGMLAWIEGRYGLTHGALLIRFGEMQYSGGSVDHFHAHIIVGGKDAGNEKLKISAGYKK